MRVAYQRLVWLSVVVLLIVTALPVGAEEQNVRPGVNRQYENPEFSVWLNRFEVPGREVFDMRHEIVSQLGLQPGMQIADVGAGTGLFTRLFSPLVGPNGKVYAVDIAESFVRHIEKTAKEQGLSNVVGVVCSPQSVNLPPDSVDIAFICDTYHHFEYPESTMRSIHTALKPGGQLVLIEFHRIEGVSSDWILKHVRAGQREFTLKMFGG